MVFLDPKRAIPALEQLRAQSTNPNALRDADTWRLNVRAVLNRSLGDNVDLMRRFDATRLSPIIGRDGDVFDADDMQTFYVRNVLRIQRIIDNAIFELKVLGGSSNLVPAANYDLGLWEYISGHVDTEDWVKLPAAAVIYTEDRVRAWSGLGNEFVGKKLFTTALSDQGPLKLGSTGSETEAWRSLGVGLVGAVGNVHRHRVEHRSDAQTYAMSVVGTASLLLTQIRWEHPEEVLNVEEARPPS